MNILYFVCMVVMYVLCLCFKVSRAGTSRKLELYTLMLFRLPPLYIYMYISMLPLRTIRSIYRFFSLFFLSDSLLQNLMRVSAAFIKFLHLPIIIAFDFWPFNDQVCVVYICMCGRIRSQRGLESRIR